MSCQSATPLLLPHLPRRLLPRPNPTHWPSLCRWYAVNLVVLAGPGRVQRAALQQPVDDIGARLLVLVSEQGVHKRVTGGLAVS